MAKPKKVVRRAWTKEDLRILKSMAKDKRGVKKIAKALRRSPGATTIKAAKLGISLSTKYLVRGVSSLDGFAIAVDGISRTSSTAASPTKSSS